MSEEVFEQMSAHEALLIHYSEIALKKGSRPFFERKLVDNLKRALAGRRVGSIHRIDGRIYVDLAPDADTDSIADATRKVFGVAWFAFSYVTSSDFDAIREKVLQSLRGRIEGLDSFKIETTRSFKEFPMTSMEVNDRLGTEVARAFNVKVRLEQPSLTVFNEITRDRAFIHFERMKGAGGLPVGSTGRVLSLLSGGLDSPVAAWLMMKRGAQISYVHFHPFSDNSQVLTSKITELTRYLLPFSGPTALHVVPAYPFTFAVSSLPPRFDVVLFRRFMFKVAEKIAVKERARALVTGESLGQVASQTLDNIYAIHKDLELPVFMPLISYDKEEIVNLAKRVGTFEISLRPYKDCCSMVSRHPETRARLERIRSLEETANMESAIDDSLEHSVVLEVK